MLELPWQGISIECPQHMFFFFKNLKKLSVTKYPPGTEAASDHALFMKSEHFYFEKLGKFICRLRGVWLIYF